MCISVCADQEKICSLGIGCATVSIFDRFRTPAWRPYRAGMFVAMGLSAVFPVIHGLQLYGFKQMQERIGLSWLILQGVLYIAGAGIYAVSILRPFPQFPLLKSLGAMA
jgi:adiponectin receptor